MSGDTGARVRCGKPCSGRDDKQADMGDGKGTKSDSRRKKYSQVLGKRRRSRSIMYNYGEGSLRSNKTKEKRLATAAHKHMQDGSNLREAVACLMNRVNQGITVNSFDYNRVLLWCSKEKDLQSLKQVHDSVKDSQMEQIPYVANMLLKCYSECGKLKTAQELFHKLTKKDIVTWNTMIAGCAKHDQAEGAVEMYEQMRNEGGQPNAITFLSVLKACASPTALKWGKVVHAHIIRSGFEGYVPIGNALVHMYASCGSIEDARSVFSRMGRRDVVSWTVMIGALAEHGFGDEAFGLFLQMQREGFTPDAITYLKILNSRLGTGPTEWVKEVHAHIMRAGLDVDVRVGTALVRMYAKSGKIEEARAVFSRLNRRDVVSWNVMIGGLAEHGLGPEAFSLFLRMQREGLTPDAITYLSILNPCSSSGATEWVKEVHAQAIRAGLDFDERVGIAFVHMYAKIGCVADARAVFDRLGRRDGVSWNVMIGILAEHGLGQEAYALFLQMQREGFTPDAFTYLKILNPCSSSDATQWVKEVHAHAMRTGLEGDVRVGTALAQMYAKSGSIEDARAVFDRLSQRDVLCWNVMIGGLAQHGLGHEAFSLFLQMQREGLTPDAITYLSVLNPCASTGAEEWLKQVHAYAVQAGLDVDVQVGSALVQMYAKTGLIADAKQVFHKMQTRDVISWSVMVGGLAQHGHGREALQLFEEMKSKGVRPNDALFVAVLSACSHAGLVEEGRLQFESMGRDFGLEPALEHHNCMVDMLGRAGLLREAKYFILNMPMKPDVVTWTSLLGACRTYNNIELAELAAKECVKLKPGDASPYIVLSNMYAAIGNWEQVRLILSLRQERGIRKDPGRCWIEVGNKVHNFLVGDTSHPESREIYSLLSSLSKKLKDEGYNIDTRLVLRNIGEEDKERAVCSHSEKLAIAYGLLHVPLGKPIRVYKNLRICTDCHAVTKLISKITGREIVARDANRFHHFKDGLCSCGDYW